MSRIGIRANWTCAKCPATATSHHIEEIQAAPAEEGRAVIMLPPPTGWSVRQLESLCPEHAPRRSWQRVA